MKTVNFAIIGYGFMGHVHAMILSRIPEANLVGVSDRNKAVLKDVPEGVRRYESNEELLADPKVDTVIISANNNQHLILVEQAARAGKDIICEKPAAMDSAELEEMIRIVEECKVKFTVHQQRRMDKDFRVMKEVFEQGLLGEVYMLKSCLYGYNGNMHDWHVLAAEGGGMLYDWGVHLIDQILWMMPEAKVKSVYADMRNVVNAEVDDYFKIILKLDNCVTAEIELGTYMLSDKKDQKWYERHWFMGGNKGTAYTDGFDPEGSIVRTSHLLTDVSGVKMLGSAGPTRSFGTPAEGTILTEALPEVDDLDQDDVFFNNFIRAYHGEGEFLVKLSEVKRVLKLMEAVRESAKTGMSAAFE